MKATLMLKVSRMSDVTADLSPDPVRRESCIESKINRIFEEAKKRNPEGYTLKRFDSGDYNSASSSSTALSPSNSSYSSHSTYSNVSNVSRSSSTSSTNCGNVNDRYGMADTNAHSHSSTYHGYSNVYNNNVSNYRQRYNHSRGSSAYEDHSESEEKEINRPTKFINPISGQAICILATTVNIPLSLQPID